MKDNDDIKLSDIEVDIWHNHRKYPENEVIIATRMNPKIVDGYALYHTSHPQFDKKQKFVEWCSWKDFLNQESCKNRFIDSQSLKIKELEKKLDIAKGFINKIIPALEYECTPDGGIIEQTYLLAKETLTQIEKDTK